MTIQRPDTSRHNIHLSLIDTSLGYVGVGVFVHALSIQQAKKAKRNKSSSLTSLVLPYYSFQDGQKNSLSDGKTITFQAELHDPYTGKQYKTTAEAITKVVEDVQIFALKPDVNQRRLFELKKEGNHTSVPDDLSLTLPQRFNYFDNLAAEFIKKLVKKYPSKQTILHTHNYGSPAFYLPSIATVNTAHTSVSPPLEIPAHLRNIVPNFQSFRARALGANTLIHVLTPQAKGKLFEDKSLKHLQESFESIDRVQVGRSAIDLHQFSFNTASELLPKHLKRSFSKGTILQKKKICLKALHSEFKKQGWEIDPKKPTVLFVGRLCKLKGIDLLVKSIRKAQEKGFNCIIMGQPQDSDDYRGFKQAMQTEHPKVPLLETQELQNKYGMLCRAAASIGLLTSFYDESPLVLPEYQALGAHCIFASVGGTSYAFPEVGNKHDPECGTPYTPSFYEDGSYDIEGTLKAFLPTLVSTLDRYNKRSEAEKNALHEHIYQRAQETFHPDKWVQRIDEIYDEAFARKSHELKMKHVVLPELQQMVKKRHQKHNPPSSPKGIMHSVSSFCRRVRGLFGV